MNILFFLLPALIASLILTAIHTYLGIHVIRRNIIFIDIALAQLAALGFTVAAGLGFEPGTLVAYLFGLGFTFLGGMFFTLFRREEFPQEAIIGVVFAVSAALAILVADRIPHGAEHIKFILSGNILWVSWSQIVKTLIIYCLLGAFFWIAHHRFLSNVWLWDLLFYLSFGLVITSSVQIAGVLLVFAFLIVPALCSALFCTRFRDRLFLGWTIGSIVSLVGIGLSYQFDFPTGPMIVATFGGSLVVSLLLRYVRSA